LKSKLGNKNLVTVLQQAIQNNLKSAIPFYEFMNLCLYHEEYGYYRSSAIKIGPEGDFYTSSSIGTIMGETLADYVVKTWDTQYEKIVPLTIVEWGGGNGRLAVHLLDQLQCISSELYGELRYIMIESSPYHQQLQVGALGHHANQVNWMTEEAWHKSPAQGITIHLANELLDAFAVHRIRLKEEQLEENWVSWDAIQGEFNEQWYPLENSDIQVYLEEEGIKLSEGQIAEINLHSKQWIARLAQQLERGQLIAIDYGDVAEEIYAQHRMLGTLMCYRKHQALDAPYEYVGEQDITAHVNFTACKHAAERAGLQVDKLVTQRQFLVDQGILGKLQDTFGLDPFSAVAKRNRAIRQLLISDNMSELFKVFIAHK